MNPRHFLRLPKTRLLLLVLSAGLSCCTAMANIHPVNGSRLSTIHVMFEFDNITGAQDYELLVFDINQPGKPVVCKSAKQLALLITSGLQFGHAYNWYFRAMKNGKVQYTSPSYHFSILYSVRTNPSYFRQEVSGKLISQTDLVVIDNAAMAINRRGEAVWFLPIQDDALQKRNVRDLDLTPAGTFTHLDNLGAYERYPDSLIVWHAPAEIPVDGSAKAGYHHQLTKLTDGSYVVGGFQYKAGDEAAGADAPRYNTLIHYNKDSSVRWYWSELESMKTDSLFRRYRNNQGGGHLNGFAFSKDMNRIFLSFKNLSDVFVLNFADGKLESSIKTRMATKAPLFRQQHGPFLTADNKLVIYNNNISDEREEENDKITHPSVQLYRYDTLTKAFYFEREFVIQSKRYPDGIAGKEGYASETSKGNILVCAGGANYAAELNRSGIKQWECYFSRRPDTLSPWTAYSNYRCRQVPSLYPVYLTLQYLYTKNGEYYFRMYNAGHSIARYELQFFTGGNEVLKKNFSGSLSPGSAETIRLPLIDVKEQPLHCYVMAPGTGMAAKTYFNLLTEEK